MDIFIPSPVPRIKFYHIDSLRDDARSMQNH